MSMDLLANISSTLCSKGIKEAGKILSKTDMSVLGIRAKVWSMLLRVKPISPREYIGLAKEAKAEKYGKILDDLTRTFRNNKEFESRVKVETIKRFLNATANYLSRPGVSPYHLFSNVGYVQGMNILAGIVLFVFSDDEGSDIHSMDSDERKAIELVREAEAFSCYIRIITCCIPMYIQLNMDGARAGSTLVGRHILEEVDPEMVELFNSCPTRPDGQVWAFRHLVAISSDVPNLEEVLPVWDILVARGFHLIPVVLVARVELIRDQLLKSKGEQIYPLLMDLPPYNGKQVAEETLRLEKLIDKDLMLLIRKHTHDPDVVIELLPPVLQSNPERFKDDFVIG